MLGERRPRTIAAVASGDGISGVPAAVPGGPSHARGAWRDPVAWALALAVFAAYFTISLFRLVRADPTSWDLGIYTEYVKQLSLLRAPVVDVRGPGFNLLGDHFQIAVGVIAPLFRLFPTPATLLFVQAACTAVSVFPVVTAGTALAGRPAGRLTGFGYGFSWGLQQMINFDFHEIALAVPLLAFSLSALVRGRVRAAVLWALPLVFVKEDQGFTVAAIGALLILSGAYPRPGRVRGSVGWGAFLTVWGLFWSVFAIAVIIPHFNPDHVYYYWKDGGVVGNASGPFSLGKLLAQAARGWSVKLPTVFLLLLPTAFAAVGSPVALIAVPSLALRFISTNKAYWGTDWHYNATVMPILFIAAIEAIARWRAAEPRQAEPRQAEPRQAEPRQAEPRQAEPRQADPREAEPRQASRVPVSLADAPTLPEVPIPVGKPVLAGWRGVRSGLAWHAAPMMAAVAFAFAFQFPLHTLWQSATYRTSPRVAADNAAMAHVPDGVTVQATLGLLAPLAARTDTFWIGNRGNPPTAYIVFDAGNSGYTTAVTDVPAFIGRLYPNVGYVQIFRRDNVYVFRRG